MTKNYLLGVLAILGLCFSIETVAFAASFPDIMIIGDYNLSNPRGKFETLVDSSVVIINPNNQDAKVTLAILDDAENVLVCKNLHLSRLDLEEIDLKREIKRARKPLPRNGVVAAIANFD